MIDPRRLVLAAATAPLLAPVAVAIFVIATGERNLSAVLLEVLAALFTAYVGTLAVGVPAMWSLWRVRALNLVSINLAGMFGGVIVFYGFLQLLGYMLQSSGAFGIVQLIWGAALGLLVSMAFSAIAGLTWRSSGRPQAGAA